MFDTGYGHSHLMNSEYRNSYTRFDIGVLVLELYLIIMNSTGSHDIFILCHLRS